MQRRRFLRNSAGAAIAAPFILRGVQTKKKIRIGQIGTRHPHASGKMQAMRKLSADFEVVGVVEPDAERRAGLANHQVYRELKWMSEEQLLNAPGLQAVAIETDVPQLVATATRALAAGMHIHHDKPGGLNLSDFKRMLELSRRKKLTVQMGYMLRYNPAFQFMYNAVRKGWLGNITEIDTMMGKMASDSLRRELAKYPGGGMFELAGHVIDSAVHALGKPDQVTAFTRRTQDDGIPDNQLAVLEYPKATATIRCNHRDPFGFPRRRFQVAGDEGSIEIMPMESGLFTLNLTRTRGAYKKGTQQVEMPRSGGRYDGEFADLARVIRGEKKLDWTPKHDLAAHEALLRASGMPVT